MSLLAVDIGSSSCKVVAFAANGEVLAQQSSAYTPEFPRPRFAELNPETFWNAVCSCCRDVSQGLRDPVRGLAASSHGETFVPVDARGEPLMCAILNQDGRATAEAKGCEQVIGRERLFQITGHFAHPMYPIPKILWLKKHAPEIFQASASFLTVIGYCLQRMGLEPYVDYSLASRFLAFDVMRHSWSDEILQAIDLDKRRLPCPVPAGTTVGKLSSSAAAQLGVSVDTPVVLGGHDQPCGALGSGVIDRSRVADSMGTYECLLAVSDAPVLNDAAFSASLNSYCHVVPDKFVTLAYFPAGIMVKWFHDLLFLHQESGVGTPQSGASEAANYQLLEARSGPGPTGLCITPHLIGSCNPEFSPHARGVISGLAPGTHRSDIYKGILEGIACELAIVAELLAKAVGPFDDIYVTGGGTRSALGLQLRAALTRRKLHVMKRQQAVCLGTAILAGIAIGQYANPAEAIDAMVEESAEIAPDPAITATYEEQLGRYRSLRLAAVKEFQ